MHTHHVTLRLLIKLFCVVVLGIAFYLVLRYGIEGNLQSTVASSTPAQV